MHLTFYSSQFVIVSMDEVTIERFLEVSSQPTWFFQWYEGKKSSSKKENGPFFLLVLSSSQLDKLVLGHNAPASKCIFSKTYKSRDLHGGYSAPEYGIWHGSFSFKIVFILFSVGFFSWGWVSTT